MTNHRWLLVAAAALAVAGCYKTPKPNCTFSCGPGSACPTDYTCGTDGICHLMQGGALAPCEQSFNDAAQADAPPMFDAPVIDASAIDATVDATVDAHVDGAPDGAPDATTCPALAIMDDGTKGAGGQDLVISLVQPTATGKIELYNTTAADIDLSTKTYDLTSPTTTHALTTGTVKAHGYLSIAWPFNDLSGGGEVVLYHASGHAMSDIDDFICWDTDGNPMTVKADAIAANKWNAAGTCVGALTGTAIERKANVTGVNATDYDPASTRAPRDCP